MGIREEAQGYARRHSGGMQPVQTVGEKLEAAYIAGASRTFGDDEVNILVAEMFGPSKDIFDSWTPEWWQIEAAQDALTALRKHWGVEEPAL